MIQKASILVLLFCIWISFQSYGQSNRDTVFYQIQTENIAQATVEKNSSKKEPQYYINIHLKKDYHSDFAQLTGDNIGNLLAITYREEIISPSIPTITAEIKNGNVMIAFFREEKDAQQVLQKILKTQNH